MSQDKKYVIKTNHLGLRHFQKNDMDYFVELGGDSEVMQFFPGGVQNREQVEARANDFISYYKEKGLPCFVMFDLETEAFVGRCGFGLIDTGEIEVGYLLHKKFWGKGLASEALIALLKWAKQNINSDYIIAYAPVEHIASQRVMQKCGMAYYKEAISKGVMCRFYRIKNR
jgi:ribosomal-protein-alanine N-acetyltransferase